MERKNQPTLIQKLWRIATVAGIGSTFFACKQNQPEYPISGTYNGPALNGRVDWDSPNPQGCDINPGEQIIITGRQATLVDNTKVVEIIEADGKVCLAMGTVRRITNDTK